MGNDKNDPNDVSTHNHRPFVGRSERTLPATVRPHPIHCGAALDALHSPPPSLSAMILERTCNARGWQRLDLKRWKVIEQRFFLGKVTLHMFADRPTFNVVSMSVQ